METESLLSSQAAIQVFGIVLRLLGALAIVLAGFLLGRRTEHWIGRIMRRRKRTGGTVPPLLAGIARYGIIAFAFLTAVEILGVMTTGVIAILAALGLAAGLALQGTLVNAASGLMLMIFRPFKVGDFVDAGGTRGTVKSITFFATEMATPDNVKVVVPNGAIWRGTIKNYGAYGTRRLDLSFGIGYEDDINQAMSIIEGVIKADGRIHKEPVPLIAVGGLAASSVNLIVQVWCDAADYGPLQFDLTKAVKEAFDRSGVKIPYPQQVVRHIGAATGAAA